MFNLLTKTYQKTLVTVLLLFSFYTASALNVNNIAISEVMANPSAVSDSAGEWFEIVNIGSNSINLNGYTIYDLGSNFHTIDSPTPLFLKPGDYFVFGRNGDSTLNGGYTPDYVYSDFTLSNSTDEIILNDGVHDVASLIYTDKSIFGLSGNSAELSQDSNFSLTPSHLSYGLGDFGTPGRTGSFLISSSVVPEPTSILLFLIGILILVSCRKKCN